MEQPSKAGHGFSLSSSLDSANAIYIGTQRDSVGSQIDESHVDGAIRDGNTDTAGNCTRKKGCKALVHRPSQFSTTSKAKKSYRNCKQQMVRAIAWCTPIAYAICAHYYIVHLVAGTDTSDAPDDDLVRFSMCASQHRALLISYFVVVTSLTTLTATAVAVYVYYHHNEPRFRSLLPPFLLHLCLASILVPLISLMRQLYFMYYIELGENRGTETLASAIEVSAVSWVLYAPLTRLCVMYGIYFRGKYDIKYGWVLLRIAVQMCIVYLFYFAQLGPESVHWISGVGLRLAIVLLIAETLFYIVRLRNSRYAKEGYLPLLYLCCYGGLSFVIVNTVLPLLDPVARPIDHFNSTIIILWGYMIEILGPTLWYTFQMHMQWKGEFADSQVPLASDDMLRDILVDPLLYPILLSCAQSQFCDENVAFLYDGYPLLAALNSRDSGTSMKESNLGWQMRDFLEVYVVKGAHTPVNLSSAHIAKFRQLHTALVEKEKDDDGPIADKFSILLAQSMREISDLIRSSGVLTMYDKSQEKKTIESEREALRRLENGT